MRRFTSSPCRAKSEFPLGAAWLGTRAYAFVGETGFRRAVLVLLLVSGTALIAQAVA